MPRRAPRSKRNWVEIAGVVFVGLGFLAAAYAALIASDTEQRDQRAYVLVTEVQPIQNYLGTGGRIHVFSAFENIGKTPVYDARWVSGIDVLPYQPHSSEPRNTSDCDAIMKLPEGLRAFFGKKQSFDKERKSPFTQAEIDAVNSGQSAIFFFGRVCYSDIFKYSHYTDFCLYWRSINNALVAEFCPTGNEGDRNGFRVFGITLWN
jgi:hypothetical protein